MSGLAREPRFRQFRAVCSSSASDFWPCSVGLRRRTFESQESKVGLRRATRNPRRSEAVPVDLRAWMRSGARRILPAKEVDL